MKHLTVAGLALAGFMAAMPAQAEVSALNVPLGAGGFGFLPLHVMKEHNLVEKHAQEAGLELTVNWAKLGGPAAMNDALLSGSAHFISAGPPAFLTLWDRTRGNVDVKGVVAISSMPMFLNTNDDNIQKLEDFTGSQRIGVTSVKVSIPSIIMQMHARSQGLSDVYHYDPFTVSMGHADAVAALISGSGGIQAHYASSPFHEIEMKTPGIRTIQNSDDVMGGSTTFTMVSTTTKFHDENPRAYAAFVAALAEAQEIIANDHDEAIRILVGSMGQSPLSNEELLEILQRPSTKYVSAPENVLKYAEFMHEIGSLGNKAENILDLFFESDAIADGH